VTTASTFTFVPLSTIADTSGSSGAANYTTPASVILF
jgi:hypothetical protein